jgi:hypothetical protein
MGQNILAGCLAKLVQRVGLGFFLVKNTPIDVRIVVGAIKRLLKPPIQLHLRRCAFFHRLKEL